MTTTERTCDVLVVGGGPAGTAAAVAASGCGASVLLLDEAVPGSRRARAAGATVLAGAQVWGAFATSEGPEVAAVVDGASIGIRPRHLILALRPHAMPWPVPGWGLPGVGTLDAVPPGPGPLVIAGQGGGVLRAAVRAMDAGTVLAGLVLGPDSVAGFADRLRLVRLRRRHIPVFLDAVPVAATGQGRFERLLVRTRRGDVAIAAGRCVLHAGWAAETTLARALGAEHVLDAGRLHTVVDGLFRTTVDRVHAIPGVAPALVARAQGRAAGHAASRALGLPAPPRRAVPAWTPPKLPDPAPDAFTDAMVVCPCEGVTAGAVRAALADGAQSWPGVKRATRAGMGRCQGRLCASTLVALCGLAAEPRWIAPRAPLRPVRIATLMRPADPHQDPIAEPPPNRWRTVPPAFAPRGCDALVIGAGVVGLCAALALAERGVDVLVIDRGEPGLAASTANAGSLHVQLLPYDFDDDDPGPLGQALALGPRSIALWQDLAVRAGESLGLRTEGGLVLAANEADLAWLARKAAFERARGIETHILGPAELAALAPALAEGYAGAAFCAAEGQIDPLRGTMALIRLARSAGVRLAPGVGLEGMEAVGPLWRVRTSGGVIEAGQVLNAAGAQAGVVGRMAGVDLPVRAVVQQVIATAPAPPMLRQLVAQARLHLSLKQTDGGQMLVGGGWPGRLDADGATRLLRRSIEGNLWTAAQVMPGLAEMEAVRAWTGLTVHLDRGPVIAATPGRPGLFHAVTANGYTLGPVAGRLAAELMLGCASVGFDLHAA